MKELQNNDEFDEEINNYLMSYTAKNVPPEKIEETIDILRQYMPEHKKNSTLTVVIKHQITYVNKFYFLASLALIILSTFLPLNQYLSYYEYLIVASPIPILIGLFELLKGRHEKMWELEKSFKYNYQQIILARLIIIISFSIIMDLLLCGIFVGKASSLILLKLMFLWIAPFSFVASVSLLIVSKLSGSSSIMLCISAWIIGICLSERFLLNFVQSAGTLTLIGAIIVSFVVFAHCVNVFYKKSINIEEVVTWN